MVVLGVGYDVVDSPDVCGIQGILLKILDSETEAKQQKKEHALRGTSSPS